MPLSGGRQALDSAVGRIDKFFIAANHQDGGGKLSAFYNSSARLNKHGRDTSYLL